MMDWERDFAPTIWTRGCCWLLRR